jgi:hypothetical protein
MSTRLLVSHGRAAGLTVATVAVLLGTTAGVAVADPPSQNRNDCAATLAAAGVWPGTMSADGGSIRLASDSFDGYLSQQEGCASGPTTR